MNLLPLIVCLVLGPGAPAPETAVTVTVRDVPEVAGPTFTVGEIANVTGADKPLAARIAGLQGGSSPLPGLTRRIDAGSIELRLRYYGIDMTKVRVYCPAGTKISRVTTTVPNTAVEDAAIAAFKTSRPDLAPDAEVAAVPSLTNLSIAPGKYQVVAGSPRGNGESAPASVPVSIVVDGKPVKSVEVMVRVRHTVLAIVAARQIAAQAVLTAADVTLSKVDAATSGPQPLQDTASVIGKRAARQIPAGRPITEDAVVSPPIIVSGQSVSVESTAGGICIALSGIARSAAAAGGMVRVYCPKTQRELTGVAIDAKTVRIEGNP